MGTRAPSKQRAGIWTRVAHVLGERLLGVLPSTTLRNSNGTLNVLPLITISGSASQRFEPTPEKMQGYKVMTN